MAFTIRLNQVQYTTILGACIIVNNIHRYSVFLVHNLS